MSDAESPKKKRGSLWRRLPIYALMIYASWCATLFFAQDWLIFPAEMAATPRPKPFYPRTEVWHLREGATDEGVAWFASAEHASADQPAPLVVFFHGNAETIDFQDDIVDGFQRMGISVLLPEYPGYGRAKGEPSQETIVADALAFVEMAKAREDVDTTRIVYHGRSLGGAVAAQIADVIKPKALILQSTLRSVAEMAYGYAAPQFIVKHPFRTDRVLAGLEIPVLVMHGSDDTILPVDHGRDLAKLAKDAVYWEVKSGHNEFPGDANIKAYWQQIETFLNKAGVVAPNVDNGE